MRVARVSIKNFRGVLEGSLLLPKHSAFVGDNNIGKSTVLEAIDLVLGPERLSRRPPIDEHDFHAGQYAKKDGTPIPIEVEVVVVDLAADQLRYFRDHVEWWKDNDQSLIAAPPPEGTDAEGVLPAVRVLFVGKYDPDEDDFTGSTHFAIPVKEDGTRDPFRTTDKRLCGFLYLRTLRTGSRALSLERGSLLDIILKLQGKQLKMWEDVLAQLRILPVAEKPELGITDVLASVQAAIREYVPAEWANNPHMRVSDLTRETLRRVLTVFMGTGALDDDGKEYSAPFQHQGTGTINTLVLALLSIIAELKGNVIFAMEEPEIAIPPHAQKRIINSVRGKSAQALFTSHSPYVLEEFPPEQVVVLRRDKGVLSGVRASLPPAVKPKKYKEEFRRRFCEALLARRVLIAEGRTEYDAFPAAARKLNADDPNAFGSLEGMGVAIVSADSDSQVEPLGKHFRDLGKVTFAIFDKQAAAQKLAIEAVVQHCYEGPEASFEKTLLDGTAEIALRRFANEVVTSGDWPSHLAGKTPVPTTPLPDLRAALAEYLKLAKGSGTAADLLAGCNQAEMPAYVVKTLLAIKAVCEPPAAPAPVAPAHPAPHPAATAAPATAPPAKP